MVHNAIITGTSMGNLGRGFTFQIKLKGDGWGSSFGGYGCAGDFLTICVKSILDVLKVERWEDLKGTAVRVAEGKTGQLEVIGHFVENNWFDIAKAAKERKPPKVPKK